MKKKKDPYKVLKMEDNDQNFLRYERQYQNELEKIEEKLRKKPQLQVPIQTNSD